ncbi:MAG TPA: hypothetical protein ENK02_11985 [Planctomycetes bacterium]|nr:hypothetical protein [Planctomycetota bacterium]
MAEEPIVSTPEPSKNPPPAPPETGGNGDGSWFAFLLSAIFLFGIFGEILYLTKDWAFRKDLTEEHLYSLSGSTKRVLSKLKEPLVIEAYFSKKIPGYFVETRNKIENFLDEYRKSAKGKIQLVYLDPLQDERTREKADRLGIQARSVQTLGSDSLSLQQLYQGLRLRYGGDKQYVIPFVVSPNALESQLTPKIQELVLGKKPKVALLVRPKANPNPFMREKNQTPSWDLVERALGERYEISRMDVSKGQLLPKDLDVLVLIEPKDLTDWEKFCIDQHLMRGGNLIVFQEAADYDMSSMGMFRKIDFKDDANGSKLSWRDQLGSYGVETNGKLVAEMIPRFWGRYVEIVRDQWGQGAAKLHYYPFWFRVEPLDWKKFAPQLVKKGEDPGALAKTLEQGMDTKDPVLKGLAQMQFFWATPVALKKPLKDGIQGKVLVRTSPRTLTESPAPLLPPSDSNLIKEREARVLNEPMEQQPLVVSLRGKFTSFFAGKPIPQRPGQESQKDKSGGLLQGQDPSKKKDPGGGKQEPTKKQEATKKQDPAKNQASGGKQGPGKKQDPGQNQDSAKAPGLAKEKDASKKQKKQETPKGKEPAKQQGPAGPPLPNQDGEGKKAEKEEKITKLDKAKKEARMVVIGDASLIRDDFIMGIGPARTPSSREGIVFFSNLLDSMALDLDLVELRNLRSVDRKLKFVDDISGKMSLEEYKTLVATKKKRLRLLNVFGPVLGLLLVGLVIWFLRSSEKRRFLALVQDPGFDGRIKIES